MQKRKPRRAAKSLSLALIASAGMATGAVAQTAAPPNCEGAPYRDFDFWVGEWDVFTPDGKKAGENLITLEENECLILERWTSVSGGTGQSYNYYDLAAQNWRQVWVSAAATIDYTGGLNDAGAMALEGEIAYRNGTTAPFRGVWTALADGSVRQDFEQYNAATEEWAPWFTGVYKRKSTHEGDD